MSSGEVRLLVMALQLLSVILAASVASAWLLRRHYGWPLVVSASIASLVLFLVMYVAASTGSSFAVLFSGLVFGAAMGAGLGGIIFTATEKVRQDNEVSFIILAIVAVNTFLFTLYLMIAGYNFQWCGHPLFIGALFLLSIYIFRLFLRWGRVMELLFGAAATFYMFIMLIASVNKAMENYNSLDWVAAIDIITDIFVFDICYF